MSTETTPIRNVLLSKAVKAEIPLDKNFQTVYIIEKTANKFLVTEGDGNAMFYVAASSLSQVKSWKPLEADGSVGAEVEFRTKSKNDAAVLPCWSTGTITKIKEKFAVIKGKKGVSVCRIGDVRQKVERECDVGNAIFVKSYEVKPELEKKLGGAWKYMHEFQGYVGRWRGNRPGRLEKSIWYQFFARKQFNQYFPHQATPPFPTNPPPAA